MRRQSGFLSIVIIALLIGAIYGWNTFYQPNTATPSSTSLPEKTTTSANAIAYSVLPKQAQQTYQLILQGGPFPHQQDGQTFGNYEKRLPIAKRGYYREYTVKTPDTGHRGARRIVCGGEQKTKPDNCYYTANHYESFEYITDVSAH